MANWFSTYGEILATLLSLVAVLGYLKYWIGKELLALKNDVSEMRKDIQKIRESATSIDGRLNKLEGRFEERGYWESRIESMRNTK